ncbi:helix-turn-helix domain-containing protein [uncultured Ruegeria sp.]|uniref:helix-turn-helix transcriptional regulator n=1 Tax=uncultured Ruegeria sp. TaxID=259304 RepID=UPI00261FDA42|nr:helix-turn-helix domain-containing protein [uncultured Ruegeria sp.]
MEQIFKRLERIEELLSADKTGSPRHEYLNIKAAADFIGISRQTLDKWRMEERGPAVHRVGRRVMYSVSDLRSFMDEHRHGTHR